VSPSSSMNSAGTWSHAAAFYNLFPELILFPDVSESRHWDHTVPKLKLYRADYGSESPVLRLDGGSLKLGTAGTMLWVGSSAYQDGRVSFEGKQVVGPRQTGWTRATGKANRGAFDSSAATVRETAERLKALEDALRTHGLIGE
jgi:hypothetical protein